MASLARINGLPAMILATQGAGYADWVVQDARSLGGWMGINPWEGDWTKFTAAGIWSSGRVVHDGDPDTGLVYEGAAGADAWFDSWFWPQASRCPGIKVWRGPNEPPCWDADDARSINAFFVRLAGRFHARGLELIGFEWPTWHPDFQFWQYLGEALMAVDYLGRHCYSLAEPWFDPNDRNSAYRLVEDVKRIRELGFRVPPCIVSETGLDRGGDPVNDGWRARGVSAPDYVTHLWRFLIELADLVPELVGIATFVWLSTGWPSFDIDQTTSYLMVQKKPSGWTQPGELPPITSAYIDSTIQHRFVINEDAALSRTIRAAGHQIGSNEFDHVNDSQGNCIAARQYSFREGRWYLWEWRAGRPCYVVWSGLATRS